MAAESAEWSPHGAPPLPLVDLPFACPGCGLAADQEALRAACYVCACGRHFRIPAAAWIALLADQGTWHERWTELQPVNVLGWHEPVSYDQVIVKARQRGHDEAVRTGTCRIGGHAVWLAVFDFAFMGGTLGVVAGERLARAMEQAAGSGWPCIAVIASGGARMQEGTLALMQMAKVNAAVRVMRQAGVPYISVLTDPTFGGTTASLALVADVNVAEPASAIGFTGPRVIKQATYADLPPDFQTAEFNLEHGQIDMVVPRPELRERLIELLDLYTAARWYPHEAQPGSARPPHLVTAAAAGPTPDLPPSVWSVVELARHHGRPYASDYIERWTDGFIELHGDRLGGDDHALVGGIGRWNGVPTMFLGQQKARTLAERIHRNFGMMHPEGFRKATRLACQAARFGFPVVVLVDTPGAFPGAGAEERGIASAIATCIIEWFSIDTPVVAAVIGEGGSGGALALATADHVVMLEHAIYSVAAPEAAASIVWRDPTRREQAAAQLGLTAPDLLRMGVVDAIVPEPPGGAHRDPDLSARRLGNALWESLHALRRLPREGLLARRRRRFRTMGAHTFDSGRP